MYEFCPEHGQRFCPIGDFTKYWCRVYRCPAPNCPGYIEIGDPRAQLLIQLELGVLSKLEVASAAILDEAFGRIRSIDYKTVSIIYFEKTVLGSYRKGEEYRIVWPDGSERHSS